MSLVLQCLLCPRPRRGVPGLQGTATHQGELPWSAEHPGCLLGSLLCLLLLSCPKQQELAQRSGSLRIRSRGNQEAINLFRRWQLNCEIHPCSEAERKTVRGKAEPFSATARCCPSRWMLLAVQAAPLGREEHSLLPVHRGTCAPESGTHRGALLTAPASTQDYTSESMWAPPHNGLDKFVGHRPHVPAEQGSCAGHSTSIAAHLTRYTRSALGNIWMGDT